MMNVRAYAKVTLITDPDPERAWAALGSGSRSLIFEFKNTLSADQEMVMLGAIMTTSDATQLRWGDSNRAVTLDFWSDSARAYIHRDSHFAVWYGRIIGEGRVISQP